MEKKGWYLLVRELGDKGGLSVRKLSWGWGSEGKGEVSYERGRRKSCGDEIMVREERK